MMDNKLDCSLTQDLLPSYIDGLTSSQTTAYVQKHLDKCEACQRLYDAMNNKKTPAELHAEQLVRAMVKARRRTRRIAWGILGVLLFALAVCFLPLTRSISVQYQALEWRCGDAAYAVPRVVSIEGTYFDFLFRTDFFDGTFWVDGVPVTQQRLSRCHFNLSGMGTLRYITEDGMLEVYGNLLLRPDGSEFAVCVMEDGHWDGQSGLMLTGPANVRQEAVQRTNILGEMLTSPFFGPNYALK